MTRPWRDRPREERYSLNPALTASVIAEATAGYMRESGVGMPFGLSYLVVPVVYHTDTRESLPATVATSLAAWLADHELQRRALRDRVSAFAPLVREGLLFGLGSPRLSVEGSLLSVPRPNAVVPGQDVPELYRLLRAGRHVGRLFGRVGSATTVFALWGVRP